MVACLPPDQTVAVAEVRLSPAKVVSAPKLKIQVLVIPIEDFLAGKLMAHAFRQMIHVDFRQVAYVLGQLQNKKASDALSQVLKDVNQHPMVRHEATKALGSIADAECVALLEEFTMDPEPIVSQSCEVALSMLEFERSGKSFEYLFHADASSATNFALNSILGFS